MYEDLKLKAKIKSIKYVPRKTKSSVDREYRGFYEYSAGGSLGSSMFSTQWCYYPTWWQNLRGLPIPEDIQDISFEVSEEFWGECTSKAIAWIDKFWDDIHHEDEVQP